MRYNVYLNQVKMLEWDLKVSEAFVMSLINEASSWAKTHAFGGKIYFHMSRNLVMEQLPSMFTKSDSVYRVFVSLKEKGLIEYEKDDRKDLIVFTNKGKEWNSAHSDSHPTKKKNSEINPNNSLNSETHPTELGSSSENNSDSHPTDNIIINNNLIRDDISSADADDWASSHGVQEKTPNISNEDLEQIHQFLTAKDDSYIAKETLKTEISRNNWLFVLIYHINSRRGYKDFYQTEYRITNLRKQSKKLLESLDFDVEQVLQILISVMRDPFWDRPLEISSFSQWVSLFKQQKKESNRMTEWR